MNLYRTKWLWFAVVFSFFCTLLLAEEEYHPSEISLGMGSYFFMSSLPTYYGKEAWGEKLAYSYGLPKEQSVTNVFISLEHFNPTKNGYNNRTVVLTVGTAYPIYNTGSATLISKLGLDLTYWEREKTFILKQTTLAQVFIGAMFDLTFRFDLEKYGAMDLSIDYHLQEFSFQSRYMSTYLQYVWRI